MELGVLRLYIYAVYLIVASCATLGQSLTPYRRLRLVFAYSLSGVAKRSVGCHDYAQYPLLSVLRSRSGLGTLNVASFQALRVQGGTRAILAVCP